MSSDNVLNTPGGGRCASAGEVQPARKRKVIPTTCSAHGGARGFTNLAVVQIGGEIMLDPHVTGGCVIVLDETAANALRDVLQEWLG